MIREYIGLPRVHWIARQMLFVDWLMQEMSPLGLFPAELDL